MSGFGTQAKRSCISQAARFHIPPASWQVELTAEAVAQAKVPARAYGVLAEESCQRRIATWTLPTIPCW